MTYKTTFHIPTEQYGFLEVEYEGEPDDVVEAYRAFKRLLGPQEGLPTKDWNATLDEYLKTGDMKSEEYEKMSLSQKQIIQEIKKSVKRIDYPFK